MPLTYIPQNQTILYKIINFILGWQVNFSFLFLFLAGIRGLVSELYGIMEYVLQMVETLTAGLRHSSGGTQTVSCGHLQRIDPSKITDVTKMVLRKLSIGVNTCTCKNYVIITQF